MAKRQNRFAWLMKNSGIDICYPVLADKSVFTGSVFHNEIDRVYKSLGGVLTDYPIGFGDFDIVTKNYFVELDEENHFTRYRKTTLHSEIYQQHKYFSVDDYINYCDTMEKGAGKTGNFWSTPKSEEQFGKSSPEKDLSGIGPARWKQRAFYDFLKDVYAIINNKPLFRFSIYQKINDTSINIILNKQRNEDEFIKYLLITLQIAGKLKIPKTALQH